MREQITKDDVAAQIAAVIETAWKVNSVSAEHNLILDLGASSLDLIELNQELEDAFSTTPLSKAEEDTVRYVGDLINVYWARVQKGTAHCKKITK